jgi:N-acetylmuramoyl-L-alanine amidase
MYNIDYNSYRAVKSYNQRVHFLVMHYTALNFQGSINALTGSLVSAHYLVPEPTDQTYINAGFKDMRIFNLVNEHERSWHAGVSEWAGRIGLNDTSIGIEIVNEATVQGGNFIFPPYNPIQIEAVKELAANILLRYPDITPVNVIGHSDISPGRKSDPGAAFPWKALYDAGIGAWYDEATKLRYQQQFDQALPARDDVIGNLRRYGYGTSNATTESGYLTLLRALQLHFRPQKYDGILDSETAAILYALVDKYFPAI